MPTTESIKYKLMLCEMTILDKKEAITHIVIGLK